MGSAHGGNRGPNDPPCLHASTGRLIDNPEAPSYDFGFGRDKVGLLFSQCRYCFATMCCVWPIGTPPAPSAWKPMNLVLNALMRSSARAT